MHPAQKYQQTERRVEGMTRDEVVIRYRHKVLILARRVRERLSPEASIDVDDLASCGAIGLLEAFERFEPTRGIQFSTFAEYRIRGAIYDALRDEDTFSRRRRQLARKLDEARQSCTAADGTLPTDQQVAAHLGMTLDKYHAAVDRTKPVSHTSIDSMTDDGDGEGRPLVEKLMDPSVPAPDAQLLAQEVRDALRDAIGELPDRQRHGILMYYGKDMSLAEIAAVYGVTVSRVSQILSEARGRLRKKLRPLIDPADFAGV